MSTTVQDTGNPSQTISDIIDQINSIEDTTSATTALTIIAYGIIDITTPNSPGTTTGSFEHNLGYAPMFLCFNDDGLGDFFPVPSPFSFYTYSSGPKFTNGFYTSSFVNAWVDEVNLYVSFTNVPLSPEIIAGEVEFTFFILNRPINSGT